LQRNGLYYAQLKIRNLTGQLPLHGETLSDAVAARQVLKMGITSGKFLTRAELEKQGAKARAEKGRTQARA
jgi:hypothetical protein